MLTKGATLPERPVTLDELVAQLESAPRHDPLTLRSQDIPSAPGIYVWYAKEAGCPVYVGKASGQEGASTRIWAQHLNPRYLERRARKFTEADSFQLSCAVTIRGQPRIDKSVFRRNVGRREQVAHGQPTVDYIRRHFELAWVILPRSEIAILERDLIARIAPTGPLYNLGGNPSPGGCKTPEVRRDPTPRNLSNRRVAAGAEGR